MDTIWRKAVPCKVKEGTVPERLVYTLHTLGSDIKKAMINNEGVVATFLNIEKAYNMLWKEGVIIKLFEAGIRGHMLNWRKDFLKNRVMQVRVWEV